MRATALVGCSGSSEPAADASVEGGIGLSVSTQNNPFFVTLVEGAEAAAEEAGVSLTVVDAGDDVTKQVSDVEDLLSKNIAVLIINPVDSDAVSGVVADAMAAGVKVIAVDRVVNGVEVDCTIASDNVMGAVEAIDGAGKDILVVVFYATDGAIAAINEGRMAATIAQQPEMIGKAAVENAVKLIAGESIEANIPVEVALVTAE